MSIQARAAQGIGAAIWVALAVALSYAGTFCLLTVIQDLAWLFGFDIPLEWLWPAFHWIAGSVLIAYASWMGWCLWPSREDL